MKLRFFVLCFAFALTAIAAHAQIGLYVNPIGVHVSNSNADTGPFAFLGENATSRTFYGAAIGGYYEFFHDPKFDVSVDLRDYIVKGNNASLNSFLIGARIAAKPIAVNFRPYLQLSGGVGTSKPPTSPVHLSRAEYGVFGGLDYSLNNHVDFRVVEAGYGSVSTVNSGNFGSGASFPSSRLFSISTGLVFRIK
jgi:hypothetical protein